MSQQALGVVTDTEYVKITPTERKPNWLLLGLIGVGALLVLTRGEKVIVIKD
ncbi:unnamed protein product [marine sediment metagenome]|uniref:Uncharacterized protein n=1 Tax=marine sediment metagenome TaxID=412755 RepID=X0S674_9ZZZZ